MLFSDMNTANITLLICILSLVISLLAPVLMARRLSRLFQSNLKAAIDYTRDVETLVTSEIPNIKRAHSLMGSIGNEAKEVRKAEKQLQLDLMSSQLGIDVDQGIDLIKQFSPRVGEMVEKNPDLLTQLAPKILEYVQMHKEDKPTQTRLSGPSKAWS